MGPRFQDVLSQGVTLVSADGNFYVISFKRIQNPLILVKYRVLVFNNVYRFIRNVLSLFGTCAWQF